MNVITRFASPPAMHTYFRFEIKTSFTKVVYRKNFDLTKFLKTSNFYGLYFVGAAASHYAY